MRAAGFTRIISPLVITAAATLSGGCASAHRVAIESLSYPEAQGGRAASYRIVNRNPALDERSLRYKEAARYVRTALSGHGLFEAPTGAAPDMIVEMDYGIEQPRLTYKVALRPVYQVVEKLPKGATPRRIVGSPPEPIDPAVEEPQLRLIGYADVPEPYFTREKYLAVSAHANTPAVEGRPPPELWRVSASIEDQTDDLRRYLPVLAATVMERLGTTTDGIVTAKRHDRDDASDFIRQGL